MMIRSLQGERTSPRIRLPPAIRTRQILDAALVEFSRHGFAATRMEAIAQRAGLSKGGVYAHFISKDEILESLLFEILHPPLAHRPWSLSAEDSLPAVIESFVDRLYAKLAAPDVAAKLRLLLVESARAPHLLREWRQRIQQDYLDAQRAMLQHCVDRGLVRSSALNDDVSLMFSPALHGLLWQMIFSEETTREDIAALRAAHCRMLLDLLQK
jgi:AcrR family transcriptional regulator